MTVIYMVHEKVERNQAYFEFKVNNKAWLNEVVQVVNDWWIQRGENNRSRSLERDSCSAGIESQVAFSHEAISASIVVLSLIDYLCNPCRTRLLSLVSSTILRVILSHFQFVAITLRGSISKTFKRELIF